jgi:small subunit ribosomal protein S21
MTIILVDDNEPIDRALRRFKKECQKSGILSELRRREFYEKPSEMKKRKAEAARRKARRRQIKLERRAERATRRR